MAVNVDSQYVKIYPQGSDVSSGEIKNQQLNEALSSGTIDSILLKSDYIPQFAYNVVVKQNIEDFIKISDVESSINTASLNFEAFQDFPSLYTKTLQVKYSNQFGTNKSIPTSSQLTLPGEIAVDNFDASIYLLGQNGTTVQKVDAGTVNGFKVEKDVLDTTGDDGTMTRGEIKALINSVFVYDDVNGSLTINIL